MEKLFTPNSSQFPNVFLDKVMPYLTGGEWKVLCYAIRHILGFQDRVSERTRHISVSMFQHGYGNGNSFDGCGLGKSAIVEALKELAKYRLLIPIGDPTPEGQLWRIPDDNDKPDIEGIMKRHLQRQRANKKQTRNARAVANGTVEDDDMDTCGEADEDEGVLFNSTEGGLLNSTEVVCLTVQEPTVEQYSGVLFNSNKEIIPSNKPSKREKKPTLQDFVKPEDPNAPTPGNIIKAWQDGIKSTSSVKAWSQFNIMVATDMVKAGITPADVTAFFASPQWVGKTPGLPKLAEQIGGWKAQQVAQVAPQPMQPRKRTMQEIHLERVLAQEALSNGGGHDDNS